MNDLKDNLIRYIDNDQDVRKAIINLISSEEINSDTDHMKKKIKESDDMIDKLRQMLGLKDNESKKLELEVEKLNVTLKNEKSNIASLEEKISSYKVEINKYQKRFSHDLEVYEQFKSLSKKTTSSLSNLFKDNSFAGFIACGVQEKNINNLWEYIKNEDIENKNEDLPALKQIFEFLFSRYSIAYPLYRKQQVEAGEPFDAQQHIKHSSSQNVSGKIQQVSFYGWVNVKTEKIIKMSVVLI